MKRNYFHSIGTVVACCLLMNSGWSKHKGTLALLDRYVRSMITQKCSDKE